MALRKVFAQLLAQANLETFELIDVRENFMRGLVKEGLVLAWRRTHTLQSVATGRLVHIARADLTDKGIALARKLKSEVHCPRWR